MRIKITWHKDLAEYRVNVPSWDGGEVVPAIEYDHLLETLRELLDVTYSPVQLPHVHGKEADWNRYTGWNERLKKAQTQAITVLEQKGGR